MSTNCLVTKLKAIVNNDNLSLLGSITINVDTAVASQGAANSRYIRISLADNCTVGDLKVKNVGGYFCNSDGSGNLGDVFSNIIKQTTNVYFSPTTTKLIVLNKDKIKELLKLSFLKQLTSV